MLMGKVLIFVEDLYEELELWYPKLRLEEAGFKTVNVALEEKKQYLGKHGYPCHSDLSFENALKTTYLGVIIPGGFAPDKLRRHQGALEITKKLNQEKKLIAFICHGGWVPISAKILKGRKVTGTLAIKDDLENAGAIFKDESVVVDDTLVSSRTPKDLPEFCKGFLKILQR